MSIQDTLQDLAIDIYTDRAGVARSSYVDRAMYGDQTRALQGKMYR